MAIRKVDLYHVALPLKTRVKHASHDRLTSDSLIARVTLTGGEVGHGEGVPRSYVTGETIGSTFAALSTFDFAQHFGEPIDYEEVVRRAGLLELPETRNDPRGMDGNAARCALELAVFDAFGQKFGKTLGEAIRLADIPGLTLESTPARVRYSGAITASSPRRERISAWKMRLYGFRQVKLKVGVEEQDDPARLRILRRILGKRMDLRIDANEAWTAVDVIERVRPLLSYYPSVLEQPVKHSEVGALSELRPRIGMPVMLDESLCGYPDGVTAIELGLTDMFNVRLSKCGGLIPTLKLIGLAYRSGLEVQLGCHPGETGLLSAAGRHLASNVQNLRFVEGSYDRHILMHNVIREDLTFGYGGLAHPLEKPGLGVRIDEDSLARLTVVRKEIRYD